MASTLKLQLFRNIKPTVSISLDSPSMMSLGDGFLNCTHRTGNPISVATRVRVPISASFATCHSPRSSPTFTLYLTLCQNKGKKAPKNIFKNIYIYRTMKLPLYNKEKYHRVILTHLTHSPFHINSTVNNMSCFLKSYQVLPPGCGGNHVYHASSTHCFYTTKRPS